VGVGIGLKRFYLPPLNHPALYKDAKKCMGWKYEEPGMINTTSLISNVIVLGGNGAMGSLFCRQLAGIAKQVIAIDLQQTFTHDVKDIKYIETDVCKPNKPAQNALSHADLVIAALPEGVAMTAWPEISRIQKKTSLLVDTLSVKTPFINAVSQSESPDEIISINPMFGPSLGFSGQSAAVIDVRHGPIADAFIALLASWGCRLVFLTAEEHDRYAAMLQTATHAAILAFGMSLQKLHYDLSAVEPLMPPPHRTLLALLARILSADPRVYWDIQSSNPFAAEARRALESGTKEFSNLLGNQNQHAFEKLLNSMTKLFDSKQLETYQQTCSQIFGGYAFKKE
jgi:4-amino-4-deoxyprephenate dehydrogenase